MATFEDLEVDWETWQRLRPGEEFTEFIRESRWFNSNVDFIRSGCVVCGCIMLSYDAKEVT